ncbi:hypothetical protein [Arthrobacter sedimenti]|uniref:hypothetical protein n=1 Tax=Arthrobacter sedimenti TaxID=2694931 RepID=UPI0014231BF0|nr:hypothetical protein [Arthrobacter sedimenti]
MDSSMSGLALRAGTNSHRLLAGGDALYHRSATGRSEGFPPLETQRVCSASVPFRVSHSRPRAIALTRVVITSTYASKSPARVAVVSRSSPPSAHHCQKSAMGSLLIPRPAPARRLKIPMVLRSPGARVPDQLRLQ